MVFPGHIGAGFLTAYALLSLTPLASGLSGDQLIALYAIGTLLGDAPDIDIFYSFAKKKTLGPQQLSGHRKYLTHVPVLWMIAGLAVFLVSCLAHAGHFWELIGLLIWLSPWSHFVCDSIDSGIMWLWPFSKKQFALHDSQEEQDARHVRPPQDWKQLFRQYLRNPLAYIEISIALLALVVAIRLVL